MGFRRSGGRFRVSGGWFGVLRDGWQMLESGARSNGWTGWRGAKVAGLTFGRHRPNPTSYILYPTFYILHPQPETPSKSTLHRIFGQRMPAETARKFFP